MSKEKFIKELVETMSNLDNNTDCNLLRMIAQRLLQKYELKEAYINLIPIEKENIINLYCQHMQDSGYSMLTIKDRKIIIKKFIEEFADISTITAENAADYIREQQIKNSSKNNMITVLRTFFEWALLKGYVRENIWNSFSKIKEPERLPKSLTLVELEKIRNACKNSRDRALIEVAYSTGARLSEISNIKLSDLNFTWLSHVIPISQNLRLYKHVLFILHRLTR
jgi:integrase/recombinase XerD